MAVIRSVLKTCGMKTRVSALRLELALLPKKQQHHCDLQPPCTSYVNYKNISNVSRQEEGTSQSTSSLAHSQHLIGQRLGMSPRTTQQAALCVFVCVWVSLANAASYQQTTITADRRANKNSANAPQRVSAPRSSSAVSNVGTSWLNYLQQKHDKGFVFLTVQVTLCHQQPRVSYT